MQARLSRVALIAARPIDGLVVTLDGARLGNGVLGTPLPVDPGSHAIKAEAAGRVAWSSTIEVRPGPATQTVTLPDLAPTKAGAPSIAASEPTGSPSVPEPIAPSRSVSPLAKATVSTVAFASGAASTLATVGFFVFRGSGAAAAQIAISPLGASVRGDALGRARAVGDRRRRDGARRDDGVLELDANEQLDVAGAEHRPRLDERRADARRADEHAATRCGGAPAATREDQRSSRDLSAFLAGHVTCCSRRHEPTSSWSIEPHRARTPRGDPRRAGLQQPRFFQLGGRQLRLRDNRCHRQHG